VPLLRSTFRRGYALWARLLHPAGRACTENLAGMTLEIAPGVFNPVAFLTSTLLIDLIDAAPPAPGARWLELGTGCGFAAIHAARRGASVVAVDLSESAAYCATGNAARNGVAEHVRCVQGDLFAPVAAERFDAVLFHPPYFPGAQGDDFERAWCYGDLPERFAEELGAHLRPGGVALLLLSTNGHCAAYLRALEAADYAIEIIVERELIVERAIGYRIAPVPRG